MTHPNCGDWYRDGALTGVVLLAMVCWAPAQAQHDAGIEALTRIKSFIEFGISYVDDDAYRFGRYRGLQDRGGYGVLNIDWYQRADHDADDPVYTRVQARDLGLDTRRLQVEQGRQGRFGLRANYVEMPMYRSDSGSTVFRGVGSNRLTLPGSWVPTQNTAGMSALNASLVPVAIEHERRRFGLGLDLLLARGWEVSSSARQERKEGLKPFGAVIGNTGGNPRAVILPEPIDYETREADVSLRYFDRSKQLEFRYLVSLFEENSGSLSWQNPYSAINGWVAAAGYPNGFGQVALPPDNQFHQASVAGGYSWKNGIRLSADVALGRMTQDESFLPYTINPALAASISQPLPRTSLDGRIDTTASNVRLTGRSGSTFNWGLSWRFDDRDNQTPRSEYVYIAGDSNNQNAAANSSFRRFNRPASYRDSRLKLDLGYRLARRTQITGSLEQRTTERTYSEVEKADETTLRIALRHSNGEWVSSSLRYEHADREGSTYVGNEPFLSGYSPGYTGTIAAGWENPPLLRRLHLADRERDRFGANVTLTPVDAWQIGLDVQRVDDDYRASVLGVNQTDSNIFTIDVAFMPSTRWSAYAFASREDMSVTQTGVSIRGATRQADALDPARYWVAEHRDNIDTVGAGLKFGLIENRLDLGIDYLHARSDTAIDVSVGRGLASAPLPVDITRLQSINLHASYRLREQWSLKLRLWNERYRSTDFALDGVQANQLANVILLGEDSPDYEVNVFSASLVYRF